MSKSQKTLTSHSEIKNWTEDRGGMPMAVKSTLNQDGTDSSVVRIAFREELKKDKGELTEISWDRFFEIFDENNLALVVSANDNKDQFNKIVKRSNA